MSSLRLRVGLVRAGRCAVGFTRQFFASLTLVLAFVLLAFREGFRELFGADLGRGLCFGGGGGVSGVGFPGPVKVAEAGAPKIEGWGVGAARQASAVWHCGSTGGAVEHGDSLVHSWAS